MYLSCHFRHSPCLKTIEQNQFEVEGDNFLGCANSSPDLDECPAPSRKVLPLRSCDILTSTLLLIDHAFQVHERLNFNLTGSSPTVDWTVGSGADLHEFCLPLLMIKSLVSASWLFQCQVRGVFFSARWEDLSGIWWPLCERTVGSSD